MPVAGRLRPQPTESVAGSCPASFAPVASASALAAFGSFPCLSSHPCLPLPGSLLTIMARDGECVAAQVSFGGMSILRSRSGARIFGRTLGAR
jgi:hypothetical protein